ncbi:hypothetical protein NE237_018109 [Protea cynaroides]|uniref:Uncharacterized protein n=1 Tax=Protea cynaroides TaxID=273540 RepID=A0A9Q0K9B4_9MAGN|nr:hypothetical protein NE237_018109 [Protea cynaroides]
MWKGEILYHIPVMYTRVVAGKWVAHMSSVQSPIPLTHSQPGSRSLSCVGSSPPAALLISLEFETEARDHLGMAINEAVITQQREHRVDMPIRPEAPVPAGINEAYEAKILMAITALISVCAGGIFGFLQVQLGNEKIKPELELSYFACNVSLSASVIVAIANVTLTCIPWNFAMKTLLLKLLIGVSWVLIMADFGLAITFNLQRG